MSNAARVRFAEILVAAGCDPFKVLTAIEYPKPRALALGFGIEGAFADKPDDDFRISVQLKKSKPPMVLPNGDRRRNVGQYSVATLSHNETSAWDRSRTLYLIPGAKILVDTFDGWGGSWAHKPWWVQIGYDGNMLVAGSGGSRQTGTSSKPTPDPLPPNYYTTGPHFNDHIPNGFMFIPPPPNWPLPDFLNFDNN